MPRKYTDAEIIDAFWARVDKGGPVPARRPDLGHCWIWLGAQTGDGYGHLKVSGRMWRAHRFAYVLANGPTKAGDLDHLCRVLVCVRPSHLELVPHQVNIARAYDSGRCRKDHELTEANVYYERGGRARRCRACAAENARERYRTRRESQCDR